jgi:hypothetical protein
MGLFDNVRDRIIDWVMGGIDSAYEKRADEILDRREYRIGMQKEFIKTKPGQINDNIVINFLGLVVDRSVSFLFGKGVEFDFGEEEENDKAREQVDAIWADNHRNILLHRLGTFGAESGTVFVKLMPREGLTPRIIALDPSLMDVKTDPNDWEQITEYVIQYKTDDGEGNDVYHKEVTRIGDQPDTWIVETFEKRNSGQWVMTDSVTWLHEFAPIMTWQNMPSLQGVWGMPDITTSAMDIQDRANLVASNISKIIRVYAHPQRFGLNLGNTNSLEMGPDQMPNFTGTGADIRQLEPAGDLASSMNYLMMLRQSMMDTTRTVDISNVKDKIGAGLTNFGVRLLYQDGLQKLETKRTLYGEALCEINRRLLILDGMAEPPECDIIWPEPLPENATEETAALEAARRMEVVSKQTVATRLEYDWEDEVQRLSEEQAAGDNLGAALLRAFDQGA